MTIQRLSTNGTNAIKSNSARKGKSCPPVAGKNGTAKGENPRPFPWRVVRLEAFIIAQAPYYFKNDQPLWAMVHDGKILMANTPERPWGTPEHPLSKHTWTVYGDVPSHLACLELGEHFEGWIIGDTEMIGQIRELWDTQTSAGSQICDLLFHDRHEPIEIHEAGDPTPETIEELRAERAKLAATKGGAA